MSFTYCVLASGSSGNCLWVEAGGVQVLVDAGISARAVERSLTDIGTSLMNVQAVLITHGHTDHVQHAAMLARKHDLEVWCTRLTRRSLPPETPKERVRELPHGGSTHLGNLTVTAVRTVHDAPGSVALGLDDGDHRMAIITDLGISTPDIEALARSAQGLVLEANHDLKMLAAGPYPERLQARIRGEHGHLSNEQSAGLLRAALHEGLAHLTLAHLSEHNNTPSLAQRAIVPVLEDAGSASRMAVAARDKHGEVIELTAGKRQTMRQLGLF